MNSEPYNFRTHKPRLAITLGACAVALALPTGALAGGGGISTGGGDDGGKTVAGSKAKLKPNGKAIPPASAPPRVQRAIRAGNKIDDKPYKYGGGHGSWKDSGYDCSGAVSYVLGKKGARLISSPMPSGSFTNWGNKGKGKWITTYARLRPYVRRDRRPPLRHLAAGRRQVRARLVKGRRQGLCQRVEECLAPQGQPLVQASFNVVSKSAPLPGARFLFVRPCFRVFHG